MIRRRARRAIVEGDDLVAGLAVLGGIGRDAAQTAGHGDRLAVAAREDLEWPNGIGMSRARPEQATLREAKQQTGK